MRRPRRFRRFSLLRPTTTSTFTTRSIEEARFAASFETEGQTLAHRRLRGEAMSTLPKATLGRTGLEVTRLGYGAMELRGLEHFRRLSPKEASALLNGVLDHGINYIDTSPDYGYSEEQIGQHISHRRGEFYLASKCGCPIEPPDVPFAARKPHEFTRANIRAVVEQSLVRMRTDYLDVVQFHLSPSRAVLEENDSIAELEA